MNEARDPLSLTVDWQGHRRVFEAGTTVVVGRAVDCEVVVFDTRVSRRHLELVSDADGWRLRDLDSANGTWADGVQCANGRINHELMLRLGHPDDGPLLSLSVPALAPRKPLPPKSAEPQCPEAGEQLSAEAAKVARPVKAATPTADLSELGLTGELSGERNLPRDPFRLRDGLTLGRDTGNDVVLMDLLVSRRHARIRRSPGGRYTVEDLDATNRTFVNGDPVSGASASRAGGRDRTALHDGDVLTVGRTRMLRAGEWLYPLPPVKESGLDVSDLCYSLPDGRMLTTGLSCAVRGPQMLAVIGPSGAGKSTLLRLLAGRLRPTSGEIRYHNADVSDHAEIRTMIGLVPQQMVAHGRLRVGDALSYAAELRLRYDMPSDERAGRVTDVLTELGLVEHVDTRVDRLSGGQQRRLAIGFELLTRPSLLLVDEPTAGLDPALVRHVMQLLRALADGGRQVIVTTHDVTHLDVCDRVLILAHGGRDAYLGPPDGVVKRFGATEWPDIFEGLSGGAVDTRATEPVENSSRSLCRTQGRLPASDLANRRVRRRLVAQGWVVVRRQLRLLAADPAYVVLHSALPVILVLLALAVPGGRGFSGATDLAGSSEAARLLVVLLVGAAFMGMAAPARDLVAERVIYRHERAAGLLPEAYLLAKFAVFSCMAVLQSVVLVALLRLARPGPAEAVLVGSPSLEIVIAVAATATACTALGLATSARVSTTEQSTVPLVVAVMAQFVLCGGIFPMTGRAVIQQLSWLAPTRWGYAAAASTVRLHSADSDPLWRHTVASWLGSLLALTVLTCVFVAYTGRALRESQPVDQ